MKDPDPVFDKIRIPIRKDHQQKQQPFRQKKKSDILRLIVAIYSTVFKVNWFGTHNIQKITRIRKHGIFLAFESGNVNTTIIRLYKIPFLMQVNEILEGNVTLKKVFLCVLKLSFHMRSTGIIQTSKYKTVITVTGMKLPICFLNYLTTCPT